MEIRISTATPANRYAEKTEAELAYIMADAHEAASAMRSIGDATAECKYLDQMNDAATELHRRRTGYYKKHGRRASDRS